MANIIISSVLLIVQLFVGMELLRLNIIRINNSIRKRVNITFDGLHKMGLRGGHSIFSKHHLVAKISVLLFFVLGAFVYFDEIWDLGYFNLYILVSIYITLGMGGFGVLFLIYKLIPYFGFSFVNKIRKVVPNEEKAVYYSKSNSYWNIFKILFTSFTFLPAMIVREEFVDSNIKSMLFSTDTYLQYISYLFPNQFLPEVINYAFTFPTLPTEFDKLSFTIIMVGLSFLLAIILDRIQYQKFLLMEYDREWMGPLDRVERKNAILLLHGFSSNFDVWTDVKGELDTSSTILQQGRLERIFALGFTDKINNGLSNQFRVKLKKNFNLGLPENITEIRANSYTWELFLTIHALRDYYNVDRVHLVAHSTGGLVVRDLFRQMSENPLFKELAKELGIYSPDDNVNVINQVSYLAVPHRGAKGISNIFLYAGDSLNWAAKSIIKLFGLGFKAIGFVIGIVSKWKPIFILNSLDKLGTSLIAFLTDGETPIDLDPKSHYLRELNKYSEKTGMDKISFYKGTKWKNASGEYDGVVGKGSRFWSVDRITDEIDVKDEIFHVDHAGLVFENMVEPEPVVAIQYSEDVWEWIFKRDSKDDK